MTITPSAPRLRSGDGSGEVDSREEPSLGEPSREVPRGDPPRPGKSPDEVLDRARENRFPVAILVELQWSVFGEEAKHAAASWSALEPQDNGRVLVAVL